MVDPDVPDCLNCGRKPTFGATYCPYCGSRLPTADGAPVAEAVLDRESLHGLCAVLLRDSSRIHIPKVGRAVAGIIKRPLPDVTREMRANRGFVAWGLEAKTAVRLAEALDAVGIAVIVVPEADLSVLPETERMRTATFGRDGLDCEAYRWDSTESVRVDWADIGLISSGRIEVREVHEIISADQARQNPDRDGFPIVAPHKIPRLENNVRHEYVIDTFVAEPSRRLRLDENTAGYSLVNIGSLTDGGREYFRAARSIVDCGGDVKINPGIRMLTQNTPLEMWQDLTFESKRDFDIYNIWLLQLLRYGLPIPAE